MSATGDRSDADLLAQLIHDLKNPLGILLSFAEEIPGAREAERAQFCDRVVANARRAIQVIDDFALLVDLRRESFRIRKMPCEWGALVKEAVAEAVQGEEIADMEGTSDGGPLHADAQRLRHAVGALLRETMHRVRRGDRVRLGLGGDSDSASLRVVVAARHEDDPHGYPFNEETVGLELARRVATAHGGSLRFEASENASVAILTLPRT